MAYLAFLQVCQREWHTVKLGSFGLFEDERAVTIVAVIRDDLVDDHQVQVDSIVQVDDVASSATGIRHRTGIGKTA